MSGGTLQADSYLNSVGTGAPNFPQGLTTSTGKTITVDTLTNVAGTASPSFPFGLVNLGNVSANDSAVVFTSSSNRTQICTPTAARTYTLPTTGISAGDTWTFYNQATSWDDCITIQSSGSNTVCIVPPLGIATLISAVATPTTAANWVVLNKSSQLVSFTPSFSAGFGTVSNAAGFAKIISNDILYVTGSCTTGTLTGAAGTISFPSALTMNSNKVSIPSAKGNLSGTIACDSASAGQIALILAQPTSSTSVVYLGTQFGSTTLLSNPGVNALFSNSSIVSFQFTIPILY